MTMHGIVELGLWVVNTNATKTRALNIQINELGFNQTLGIYDTNHLAIDIVSLSTSNVEVKDSVIGNDTNSTLLMSFLTQF